MKLYTARDIVKAFPWITAGLINHRVKEGVLRLKHPSTGTGIPNMFTMAEVVHCAVLDELATIGCLGKLAKVRAAIRLPSFGTDVEFTGPDDFDHDRLKAMLAAAEVYDPLQNPFEIDLAVYEEHSFRVVVRVSLLHEHDLAFSTRPTCFAEERVLPGRYYWITYLPETLSSTPREEIEKEVAGWLTLVCPKDAKRAVTDGVTIALVGVRALYERAARILEG